MCSYEYLIFPGKIIATSLTGYITIYRQSSIKCQPAKISLISDYLRKKSWNE